MNKGGNVEEIQPFGNLNMPKKAKKPKKLLRKVIAVIIAITLAVGAFFLVRFIIEKVNENAGIKVGDTHITREKINTIKQQVDTYKKNNPLVSLTDTAAEDILIMNAALKSYITKCNAKTLSKKDISEILSNPQIESLNEGSFEYISNENQAYKKELSNCIIQQRRVFRVSISYETPYMQQGTDAEIEVKHKAAKNKLETVFLPLFKQNKSAEEIAELTDMNLLKDEFATDFDFTRLKREYITNAKITNFSFEDGVAGGNYGETELKKDSLGELKLLDKEIFNLKIGENTGVIATTSGVFTIARLESSSNGSFMSWDEFLEKIKNDNNISTETASTNDLAYAASHSLTGRVCFAVGPRTATCQGTELMRGVGGSHIYKPPFSFIDNEAGDYAHVKAYKILVVDSNNHPVNGVKFESTAECVKTWDTSSRVDWNGLNYTVPPYNWRNAWAIHSDGIIFGMGNCNCSGTLVGNFTAPNGYVFAENGLKTLQKRYPIAATNEDGVTDRSIQLRKEDSPNNISAQANSKVSVTRPSQTLPYNAAIAENNTNANKKGWAQNLYARVGDTVSFKHEITNFSATHSDWNIWFDWRTSGANEYTGEAHGWHIGTPNPRAGAILRYGNTTEVEAKTVGTSSRPFTVTASMVGKTICQKINWSLSGRKTRNGHLIENRANESGQELIGQSTPPACVYIAYDYTLKPCVGTGSASCYYGNIPKIPGESIGLIPKVLNPNGNPTKQTAWKISHWKITGNNEPIPTPNIAPDENTFQNNPDPCSVYRITFQNAFTPRDCSILSQGTNTMDDDTNEDLFPKTVSNFTVPKNAEVGSRYCFALSISPYKLTPAGSQAQNSVTTTNQWRHSGAVCILVGKRPKMQIWGNGVYSKSGIKTSTTSVDGKLLGSWVEYEAITGQTVKGFFSESTNNSNKLTANNYTAETGAWGSSSSINNLINNITSRYSTAKSSVTVTGNPTAPADIGIFGIVYNATSPIETHVVYAKNIRITGNIIAKNPQGANVKSFQQIIIIADNIYIAPNVTQIDAWLVSKNTITTCSHAGFQADISKVNYSSCGQPLTVNGPIIAKKLNSWRTGENSKSGDTEIASSPSEIYNQRADIYMWAFSQASGDGKITTSYSKELPVRY